ncbi:MAG: hypothetical protein ACPLYF_02290, partial [Fervidobacterium sp.]
SELRANKHALNVNINHPRAVPTDKEVAVRLGETPETVRPILYGLAPKIGWKEQKKEEAVKEAENAINLAGWLKLLEKEMEKFKEISEIIEAENLREINAFQVRWRVGRKIEEINMMAKEELKKLQTMF